MTVWQILLYPAASSTPMGELTDVRDRRFTWRLSEPADISFTLNARHEQAAMIDELVVDAVVLADGVPWFRGRVGQTQDSADEDIHLCTFAAVDYAGVLARRVISTPQAPWVFTGVAQGSIVRQLIAWTQGTTGGNLGITATSATVPDTATTRTITYEPARTIAESIDDLAVLENGFDWWIDAGLVAHLASPQRGTARDLPCEYGSTVTSVTRSFDPAGYANAIMPTGANAVTPQYATAGNLATRPEGRIDGLESFPDIASTTVLQSAANGALAARSAVVAAYQCTMTPGKWRPADLWLGDSTVLVFRSGRLDVAVTERVTEINVTLDEDGTEEAALTLGAPPPSMLRRLRSLDRRVTRVERLGG